MADVSKLIADLIQAGLDPMLVGRVAATIAEVSAPAPAVAITETAEERKKRIKRENNQRAYETKKADRDRLNAPEKDLNAPESAAPEKDLNAPELRLNQAALARVEDKLLTTSIAGDSTTLHGKTAFSNPPEPEELARLRSAVWEACGDALDDTAIGVHKLGGLVALLSGDKPCDLECDLLPLIRAKAARSGRRTIKTWDYFRNAALEARDARLRSNPDVIPLAEHRRAAKPGQYVEDEFEAARQRVIERFQ